MKLRKRSAAQITKGKFQEKTKKREKSSSKKSLRKEARPTNVEESSMDEASEKEYDVEKVLDFRQSRRKGREFKILWKGYPLSDATWEPEANLDNARKLVDEFLLGKQRPALKENQLADSSSIRTRKTPMESGGSFEIQEGNSQNAKMTDVKKIEENVMAMKGNSTTKTKGKMTTMDSISPPLKGNRPKNLVFGDDETELDDNDPLSHLKPFQPLFTSTPIRKGLTKENDEGFSAFQKMNKDFSNVSITLSKIKKRWNEHMIKTLRGALYVARKPGADTRKLWSKISLMVGNGYTAEDCQWKAKQIGWSPHVDQNEETDQWMESDDDNFVGRITKAGRAGTSQPGPSCLNKTDSVDLEDSYFKGRFNASDDELEMLCYDPLWADLAPSPNHRAIRKPLHEVSICDQFTICDQLTSERSSSTFSY